MRTFLASRRSTRKAAVAVASLFLAVGALSGCATDDTPDNALASDAPLPTEIPAGTKLVIADQSEFQQSVLKASGELDKLPFEYEFANFVGGPAILEAFRAGAADVARVGDTPPIQALIAGQDVPIIHSTQSNPDNTRLAVAADRDITTLADLKGKKIAYAEGTAQQAIVLRALAKAGLSTEDVELTRLQLSEFPDAIRTGQVDVAPLNEPNLTRFLNNPGTTVIDTSESGGTSTGLSYLYARSEAIQDPAKAAALQAYITAFTRAVQWSNDNPEQWLQSYYVENQGLTPEDGQRIVDSLGPYVFPTLDDALVQRQQDTIDVIDDAGELPKSVEASDGFDLRFADVGTTTVEEVGGATTRSEG
ncbi:ABC transporter substrate-binding protein [Rhodococcoides kyotonense]|uniref:Sulfonate transport system substrate-binding protein n=1 Tax=Rhodococcoides kyotonense TaxID=398843 RepID=A0A239GE81_9NOCA|nr:ABC transporter substrate-binding protein [Rhodococcus kyotonensis]SNS67042.1 sulfonate transport system substrate-binding protein [Rhodococcus kyotonensis]